MVRFFLGAGIVALSLAPCAAAQASAEASSPRPVRVWAAPLASVPLSSMADAYHVGVGGTAGVELDRGPGRLGVRADVVVASFGGRERSGGGMEDDARVGGVVVSAVVPVRAASLLVGAGAFNERDGDRSPYGVVPSAEVGLAFRAPVGPTHVRLEVRARTVLSDLLAGSEFTPSVRVPIAIGIEL